MSWINPKLDWQAGDGIKSSDLNRIESNTKFIYDVIDIHGKGESLVTGQTWTLISEPRFVIPPSHKLVICRAFWHGNKTGTGDDVFFTVTMRFTPNIGGLTFTTHASTAIHTVYDPHVDIYVNSDSQVRGVTVNIEASSHASTLSPWQIRFAIVPV
jgi:hypothetical protein